MLWDGSFTFLAKGLVKLTPDTHEKTMLKLDVKMELQYGGFDTRREKM